MSKRVDRVQSELQAVLAEALRGVKDPRVGLVSITALHLSGDLQVAKIKYLPFGGGDVADTQKGLERASGWLRREVGQRMRMKNLPELVFIPDKHFDEAIRVTRLLDEMSEE